jgi:hypothetical protein
MKFLIARGFYKFYLFTGYLISLIQNILKKSVNHFITNHTCCFVNETR